MNEFEIQIESIDLFNLRGGDIEINICQIQRAMISSRDDTIKIMFHLSDGTFL